MDINIAAGTSRSAAQAAHMLSNDTVETRCALFLT